MAITNHPDLFETASTDGELCPLWTELVEDPRPTGEVPLATVTELRPRDAGAGESPSPEHTVSHPSTHLPAELTALPVHQPAMAVVLPFPLPAVDARAIPSRRLTATEARAAHREERRHGPVDHRPPWLAAAFLASAVTMYVATEPVWLTGPDAADGSSLRRLAAHSWEMLGTLGLVGFSTVIAACCLLVGATRPA